CARGWFSSWEDVFDFW
nr:immunoglobulin heavy chain junction region [Macaca mulatta]MOW32403.1 immunoglobulin heavy chain junction region [Macaca mulatta]MOW32608.1 immunoglobulin heavy chain junction region [Macaca mulatta]MOW32646.1 immunoglobulin heavy chain junction region [Macaca mulatta]MOW32705.1 immunoglobulin heavy chain junction region [Macaca mulatta]